MMPFSGFRRGKSDWPTMANIVGGNLWRGAKFVRFNRIVIDYVGTRRYLPSRNFSASRDIWIFLSFCEAGYLCGPRLLSYI